MQGTHSKERENRKRKTLLTNTGLLMEGVITKTYLLAPSKLATFRDTLVKAMSGVPLEGPSVCEDAAMALQGPEEWCFAGSSG
jgi:hypothetical protein